MTKSVSTKLPPQETRDGYILGHLSKGMGFRFGYDCEFPNPYPEGPAGDAFVAARHDSVRGMTGTRPWAGKSPPGGARTGGNHFGRFNCAGGAGAVRGCKAPCRVLPLPYRAWLSCDLAHARAPYHVPLYQDMKRGSGRQLGR